MYGIQMLIIINYKNKSIWTGSLLTSITSNIHVSRDLESCCVFKSTTYLQLKTIGPDRPG